METSPLFSTEEYKQIENELVTMLNAQPDFLSEATQESPRAVGDAIQIIIGENFQTILGTYVKEYSNKFARRAMADLAFSDADDFYYVVDVKTHRVETSFNMPNLISVERLARFYEDDHNYFVLLLVSYTVTDSKVTVTSARFIPIEFLSWKCLTIGALGWGQIQIGNSNYIDIVENNPRQTWMMEFCDTMLRFYPKEIGKIERRMQYFVRVREYWEKKGEAKQTSSPDETTIAPPPLPVEV